MIAIQYMDMTKDCEHCPMRVDTKSIFKCKDYIVPICAITNKIVDTRCERHESCYLCDMDDAFPIEKLKLHEHLVFFRNGFEDWKKAIEEYLGYEANLIHIPKSPYELSLSIYAIFGNEVIGELMRIPGKSAESLKETNKGIILESFAGADNKNYVIWFNGIR